MADLYRVDPIYIAFAGVSIHDFDADEPLPDVDDTAPAVPVTIDDTAQFAIEEAREIGRLESFWHWLDHIFRVRTEYHERS